MLTLDVGCGNKPHGKVNCDRYIGKTPHLHEPHNIIDTRRIRNFVRADACFLPFRSSTFERVFCFHVLEHLDHPVTALNELLRVSKHVVIVKLPHRFAREKWLRHKTCEMHKHVFNVHVLSSYLKKRGLSFEITVRCRDAPHIPFIKPFLRIPWEIKVVIEK